MRSGRCGGLAGQVRDDVLFGQGAIDGRGGRVIESDCKQTHAQRRAFLNPDVILREQGDVGGHDKRFGVFAKGRALETVCSNRFGLVEADVAEHAFLALFLGRRGGMRTLHADVDGPAAEPVAGSSSIPTACVKARAWMLAPPVSTSKEKA